MLALLVQTSAAAPRAGEVYLMDCLLELTYYLGIIKQIFFDLPEYSYSLSVVSTRMSLTDEGEE